MRVPNDGRPGPDCFVAMRMKFPHLAPLIVLTRQPGSEFLAPLDRWVHLEMRYRDTSIPQTVISYIPLVV